MARAHTHTHTQGSLLTSVTVGSLKCGDFLISTKYAKRKDVRTQVLLGANVCARGAAASESGFEREREMRHFHEHRAPQTNLTGLFIFPGSPSYQAELQQPEDGLRTTAPLWD